MLSRWLLTRPLPVAPAPIGYCGWNRRFGLRIYFHIEQSSEPHHYFARTPYPFHSERFRAAHLLPANRRACEPIRCITRFPARNMCCDYAMRPAMFACCDASLLAVLRQELPA
jgi:hypothetical protein